jgi:hypothetical protein
MTLSLKVIGRAPETLIEDLHKAPQELDGDGVVLLHQPKQGSTLNSDHSSSADRDR